MGCVSSSEHYALEQRVRALEERLQAPNDFTQERLAQALAEKYGEASNELVRLQNVLESIQNAQRLAATAEPSLKTARDVSSVRIFERGVENVVDKLGLVVLAAYTRERLFIKRSTGEKFELVNSYTYSNIMGSKTYILMPGDSVTWTNVNPIDDSLPKAHCFFVPL